MYALSNFQLKHFDSWTIGRNLLIASVAKKHKKPKKKKKGRSSEQPVPGNDLQVMKEVSDEVLVSSRRSKIPKNMNDHEGKSVNNADIAENDAHKVTYTVYQNAKMQDAKMEELAKEQLRKLKENMHILTSWKEKEKEKIKYKEVDENNANAIVENIVQDTLHSAVVITGVEPSVVEEVIYIPYEEIKEDETLEVNSGDDDKIVEVQLPDGRRVRLQVPQDQDPEAFAAEYTAEYLQARAQQL